MKTTSVLAAVFCLVFVLGAALELVAAETPTFVDAWFNLATALVLISVVVTIAAKVTSDWKATISMAAATGSVVGVGLTLGLWFPFAASIGDREVGLWLPGEYNIVMMVLWDGMIGAVLGVPCGFLALFFKRNSPPGQVTT